MVSTSGKWFRFTGLGTKLLGRPFLPHPQKLFGFKLEMANRPRSLSLQKLNPPPIALMSGQ